MQYIIQNQTFVLIVLIGSVTSPKFWIQIGHYLLKEKILDQMSQSKEWKQTKQVLMYHFIPNSFYLTIIRKKTTTSVPFKVYAN